MPDFVIHRLKTTRRPTSPSTSTATSSTRRPTINNLADDAAKRAGMRAAGRLVWNLTWRDVDEFHKAAVSESAAGVPLRRLLPSQGQQIALHVHHAAGGNLDLRLVDRNPMDLLLEYLQAPDAGDWERLALSAVAGAFSAAERKGSSMLDAVPGVLASAVANGLETVPSEEDGEVMIGVFETEHRLRVHCLLQLPQDGERWTVITSLPDAATDLAAPEHRRRWQDWLQWANVLQFLRGTGRDAIVCAASSGAEAIADAWLADGGERTASAPAAVELSEDQIDQLELLEFVSVRELVESVLEAGAPDFVAGFESEGGAVIEAAWPERRVGITAGDVSIGEGLATWDIRDVSDWTKDGLLTALEE